MKRSLCMSNRKHQRNGISHCPLMADCHLQLTDARMRMHFKQLLPGLKVL
jgi:hypothetical protein